MNNKVQEIHRERLYTLYDQIECILHDTEYSLKKVDSELWGCYSDIGKEISSKPHKPSTLLLWLHECRDKATEMVNYYQQITEELDDIEDEVNRDEVIASGR